MRVVVTGASGNIGTSVLGALVEEPRVESVLGVARRLPELELPKVEKGDPVFDALTRRGLILPEHSTALGSSIREDEHYDQVAFFPPGETEQALITACAVFDWDGALFRTLWNGRGPDAFFEFARYHISDHRLLWAQLALA